MCRRPTPLIVGLGLLAVVAVLAVTARFGRPLAGTDRAVLDTVLEHRSVGGVDVARSITDTGNSPLLFLLVASVGLAVRLRTGRWWPGLLALLVAGVGVAVRYGLSQLVRAPRPDELFRAAPVSGFSFPSGHTVTSALIAGTLAYLLSQLHRPHWVWPAAAVLVSWAVLVGLTRIYLGVHWLSDVLGGWLFAAAVLTVLVPDRLRVPVAADTERASS